jgi:hypothetical protein
VFPSARSAALSAEPISPDAPVIAIRRELDAGPPVALEASVLSASEFVASDIVGDLLIGRDWENNTLRGQRMPIC